MYIRPLPSSSRVFPEPILPQIREMSPLGNVVETSTREKDLLGVVGPLPPGVHGCDHVIVADRSAISSSWR